MVLLLLVVIYGFSKHSSQAQDCTRGPNSLARFGPSCEYLCHCGTFQCNRETGACPNNGECDDGWMGSGCQYVNVPPFAVSVFDSIQTVLCGSVGNTTGQKDFFIYCSSTLYGQYLNITYQSSAGLQVCEIQVPAGMNLAYGKPAFESSLLEVYYASNAVDGLAFLNDYWLTCTHTMNSTNPWWLLDLRASVKIQWFRIFNRCDTVESFSVNERLRNFRILLSQDNATFTQSYQDQNNGPNDPPLVIEPGLKPDVLARFVKIDLQGINRILSLCEVQVFGECVPGYYGSNCNKSCFNCKNSDCDKITGRCQSCVAGKQGDLCEIDCADGFYGDNCSHNCGSCRDRDSCDKVNGHCPRGCQNGWKGAECLQECTSTYYGPNCAEPCGHCLNNTCDRFTGNCSENGCESGWQGSRCDIKLMAKNFQEQPVTDTKVVVISASIGAAVAIAVIIITAVICITVKRRRKRNTMERNTKTMEMSPNSRNLAGINADGQIQTFDNTPIEHPRTYYNIEDLNQNQRVPTNITSTNATVESDVNLYSHYEKLKHNTGAAEAAYSAIDHSQSGRHKELLYCATLDESNAYYNTVQ